MRIIVKLDNVDITNRVLLNKTSLNKATNNRSGNASFSVIASSSDVALYDAALYDSAVYDSSVSSEYTNKIVTIETASTNELIYKGIVTDVEIKVIKPIEHLYDLKLKEYSTVLDEVLVVSESYSSKTNEFIIDDIFASYLPSVDTTNVQNLFTLANYQIKDKTIKAVLDELAKLTNGVWWLTADDELFFTSILYAPVAPYKLTSNSTDPDYFKAFNLDIKKNTKDFANRVIVLGGVDIDGDEVRAEANNTTSQTNLGKIVEKVIVNREITITAIAELLADAELDNRVLTQIYGSFDTMQAGFEVGQVLTVYQPSHAVNQDVLITGIDYTWIEPDKVRYKITFGPKPVFADVVNKLLGKDSKMVSTAIPDGSITASKIASVNTSVIQGTIQAAQISTVNAASIQGTVVASQVGSVNASVIQGVIVSSQVADGIINDLAKYSDALRPIPILAAAPSLPSANYPLNSFYYNSSNSTFYRNIAGTWTATTENDAVSGKLDLYHIGTIRAERINGLIAAAQIGSVNVTSINGSITSSQITSLAADKITGSLVASQISSVHASAISGTIQAAQIATITAGQITGQITSTQIGSVNAATITVGQISAGQISSVNAATITVGQINSTQISSVNAATITVGQIVSTQIASVNAASITVGKITSNQITSIDAATITVGQIVSTQIASVNAASITVGQIKSDQIENINGSKIVIGSITADKIGTVHASAITGSISANQITNVYGNVVTSNVNNPFGNIYCTGDITIASPNSLYIDNGQITVNGWFGNQGMVTCKHFTQTGNNVSLANPTNWRNAIGAAATSHTHAQSEITNLVTDLGNKSSSTHTHTATVTLNVATANVKILDYSGNWHNVDYVTEVTVQSVSISQPT